jgi:SAM-dependent methyltransferase
MIPPRLRWTLRRALMRTGLGRHIWWRTHGVGQEIDFWSEWFQLRGGARWSGDYARRLETAPLIDDPLVTEWLDQIDLDEVRIIDVGAGPISRLGIRYPGKSIAVVAVDALAEEYDTLLRTFGVDPYVRTVEAHGERLLDYFPPTSFDVAYAVNSVDHSYDPVRIIKNMVELVRPDGAVLLRHVQNEGEHRNYSGLHQWNFDVAGRDLLVWNHAQRCSLQGTLGAQAIVEAWVAEGQVLVRVTRRAHAVATGD